MAKLFIGIALGLLVGGGWAATRTGKNLSIVNIIKFENGPCNASSTGLTGTCYTSKECLTKGGTASGSCASGFGVCCLFEGKCGGVTSENNTHFKSEPASSNIGMKAPCNFKVCPMNKNICQLRLDFIDFEIGQPSTTTEVDVTKTGAGAGGIQVATSHISACQATGNLLLDGQECQCGPKLCTGSTIAGVSPPTGIAVDCAATSGKCTYTGVPTCASGLFPLLQGTTCNCQTAAEKLASNNGDVCPEYSTSCDPSLATGARCGTALPACTSGADPAGTVCACEDQIAFQGATDCTITGATGVVTYAACTNLDGTVDLGLAAQTRCLCNTDVCDSWHNRCTQTATAGSRCTSTYPWFTSHSNTHGQCKDEAFSVSSPGKAPPVICGKNTGQHMYVDADGMTCNQLSFTWMKYNEQKFNIKISQIECGSEMLAPPNCLQYFTGLEGTIKSFNFDENVHLADQYYDICIRNDAGYCQVCYAEELAGDYAVSKIATHSNVGSGKGQCNSVRLLPSDINTAVLPNNLELGNDWITILGGGGATTDLYKADRFCGSTLHYDVLGTASQTVCSKIQPFRVGVHFDSAEAAGTNAELQGKVGATTRGDKGFKLTYKQNKCT